MRINEVEFVGFKSFVDKTRFIFKDNITGIVGPNGCGKSNIVDALKWVMGELSAKSLRGASMEDVIFNGTSLRKPLSMAQVSLIFSTEDGIVPAGYELYRNIEITRRLYRSGESEYLINKQPARLKDIQEMLMDTGLGAKAYSIIEQGEISRVISAKPEERRLLIEEAAGITKFRVKRDQALRKVERTLADLDRVQDVVGEIKRQMKSLSRQADKARKYKEFKEELREIDFELGARKHGFYQKREAKLNSDLDRLGTSREKTLHHIETGESDLAQARIAQSQVQVEVEDARLALSGANQQIRDLENQRNILDRDIENETAKARTFKEEIIRVRERMEILEKAAVEDKKMEDALFAKAGSKQKELENFQEKLIELKELMAAKTADTDQVRSRQVEIVGNMAHLETRVKGWDDRRDDLLSQSEILTRRKEQNIERLEGLKDRLGALRQEHGELITKRKTTVEKLTRKQDRLGVLKEQMNLQREKYEQSKEHFQQISVRLNSLVEMKRNMEGYREGVKNILLASAKENEAGGTIKGVIGVIADMVTVPKKYEAAFEAVLGERLQSVVVNDLNTGMEASTFLKSRNSGRGSFIPKIPKREKYTEYPALSLSQSDGPLIDMVKVEKGHENVIRHLLDGVLVVDDLPKAVRLHKANGYTGAFVTPDGEIVDPHGAITGGSKEALSSGILQMKREIEELTDNGKDQKMVFEKASDKYLRSEGLIATQENSVKELIRKNDEIGLAIRETEGEVQRTGNELENLKEAQGEIEGRIAGHSERIIKGDEAIQGMSSKLTQEKSEFESVKKVLFEKENGTKDISESIEELNGKMTYLAAEISGNKEKGNAASDRVKAAENSIVESKEQVDRLKLGIDQAIKAGEEAREKISGILKDIEKMLASVEEKADVERRAKEKHNEIEKNSMEMEKALKIMRKDVDGIGQQIADLNMKSVELKIKKENLVDQIEEKYSENLLELLNLYGESEIDSEALKTRQRELGRKLQRLGDVNLTAIEEHDETKKRYDFYTGQQEDLLKSIDNLRQAISKINKESRERFATTFNAVAAKFSQVIPMLFGGGTAKLSLTESNDILEAGVEVHVRPPGKKLQNMNLLSGGEKAMAAIGLIFSIFLIKPSPFCLLDEVDAPLDDANIMRFNGLLGQMAKQSQVILITHNKRTMEMADALFGVTMQEKGVSKLVSVQFEEAEKMVDN